MDHTLPALASRPRSEGRLSPPMRVPLSGSRSTGLTFNSRRIRHAEEFFTRTNPRTKSKPEIVRPPVCAADFAC